MDYLIVGDDCSYLSYPNGERIRLTRHYGLCILKQENLVVVGYYNIGNFTRNDKKV